MTPTRLVSLVPSLTELLVDLGLEAQIVGVTRFCVRPAHLKKEKTIVGGTKNVRVDKVQALAPDLVVANKEENARADVEAISAFAPVFLTDISTLDDALAAIHALGAQTGTGGRAQRLAGEIAARFDALGAFRPLRAAYFIWQNPWMTVGGDTFIHDVMARAGFVNVYSSRTRYPEVTLDDVAAARPDVLLFSSEPFPFADKHLAPVRAHLPGVPCLLVDGEAFSWYGSRLLYTPHYVQALRAELL